MKLYDKIKIMLEENVVYRNSDKELIWAVWSEELKLTYSPYGYAPADAITYREYKSLLSTESIRRARQLVQHDSPNLCPTTDKIRKLRRKRQDEKGTFAYRDTIY